MTEPATSTYTTAADSTFTTAYDANGRPVTQTLPGGVSVTSGYDQMGNLTSQAGTGADAVTASRTFGYDLAGNLTSAATAAAGPAPATSESFTYNDRGGLLTASGTAGSSSFGYNGDGLLTSRTDAAGTTSYTYDGADRLQTLTDAATGTALTYGYNQLNQVSQIQYGTSADVRTFGYDSLHRLAADTLKTAGGATAASIAYGYDLNGNLTAKTTTGFAGSSASTYTYDEANRLTSWNNGTTTTNYAYDASGNRTQIGVDTYTYDARDQLTTGGGTSYTYTARGTLASQTSSAGTASYSFDAYGQQITAGPQTYTYDGLGRTITGTPSGGAPVTLSYSGTGNTLASDGANTYTWDPSGGLIGVGAAGQGQSAGVLAFTDQHTDVAGDFTASAAALTASVTYGPLGNVTATSGTPGGQARLPVRVDRFRDRQREHGLPLVQPGRWPVHQQGHHDGQPGPGLRRGEPVRLRGRQPADPHRPHRSQLVGRYHQRMAHHDLVGLAWLGHRHLLGRQGLAHGGVVGLQRVGRHHLMDLQQRQQRDRPPERADPAAQTGDQ